METHGENDIKLSYNRIYSVNMLRYFKNLAKQMAFIKVDKMLIMDKKSKLKRLYLNPRNTSIRFHN